MLWLGLGRDRLRAGRGLGHKEPGAVHVGDGAEARAAVAATGLEGTEDDRGRGAGARLRGAAEVWECGARGWRRLAWIQRCTRSIFIPSAKRKSRKVPPFLPNC